VIAWIGLGANLGDRRGTLARACRALELQGLRLRAVSDLYCTAPLGPADQPDFLNAVIEVECGLSPEDLLERLQDTERGLGRRRRERWREREIDLDLLLVREGGSWLARGGAGLELPHPRLAERAFVLAPLLELRPGLEHPGTGRPLAEALARPEIRAQAVQPMGEGSGWYRIPCEASPSKA
jgi:2-amino-4-hydroxy-6-hydroxymethyldihydropteridine diphosphokinase